MDEFGKLERGRCWWRLSTDASLIVLGIMLVLAAHSLGMVSFLLPELKLAPSSDGTRFAKWLVAVAFILLAIYLVVGFPHVSRMRKKNT